MNISTHRTSFRFCFKPRFPSEHQKNLAWMAKVPGAGCQLVGVLKYRKKGFFLNKQEKEFKTKKTGRKKHFCLKKYMEHKQEFCVKIQRISYRLATHTHTQRWSGQYCLSSQGWPIKTHFAQTKILKKASDVQNRKNPEIWTKYRKEYVRNLGEKGKRRRACVEGRSRGPRPVQHCGSSNKTALFTGTGTTYRATHAFVGILANDLELQSKLQKAVDDAIGARQPRLADKERIPLIEAVNCEKNTFWWIS